MPRSQSKWPRGVVVSEKVDITVVVALPALAFCPLQFLPAVAFCCALLILRQVFEVGIDLLEESAEAFQVLHLIQHRQSVSGDQDGPVCVPAFQVCPVKISLRQAIHTHGI